MAFEVGGRADKFGNRYEDYFVVSLLVQLLRGGILGVTVEPIGPDEDGVDVLVENNDHSSVYYQCKSRNGDEDHWTLSRLNSRGFFECAKKHIIKDSDSYFWISPIIPCIEFHDLCLAARNSPSATDFYNFQVCGKSKEATYNQVAGYFGLDDDSKKIEKMFFYLNRIGFETFSDDSRQLDTLHTVLEYLYWGNGDAVFDRLCAFSKEDHLGKCITRQIIIDHLSNTGYSLFNLRGNLDISSQIQEQKKLFKESFSPIHGNFLETSHVHTITDTVLNATNNILILGAPGAGKSGVVQGVIRQLEEKDVPILPLRLDRIIPKTNAFQYGKDLGFPTSPVICLSNELCKGQTGVLILDQLDSLRWSGKDASNALQICSQMICQAQQINQNIDGGQIRIIFVCRTFDYENTQEIRKLFENGLQENANNWAEIKIDGWTADDVSKIVEVQEISQLMPRTRQLLNNPNCLSIWLKLDEVVQREPFNSEYDLMEKWFQQILKYAQSNGLDANRINSAINEIIEKTTESSAVPETVLNITLQNERDFCISEGLIIRNARTVSFPHQSIPDYLRVNGFIKEIYSGTAVEEIVFHYYGEQLPQHRIMLQMLWDTLRCTDLSQFLAKGDSFIRSSGVRFYYKCTFWEAFSQIEDPNVLIMQFLKKYWDMPEWKDVLQETVIRGRFAFVGKLIEYNFYSCWSEPDALAMLRSIIEKNNVFVCGALQPLAFTDESTDAKIFALIDPFIEYDCDEMFRLRMDLLEKYPAKFHRSLTILAAEKYPARFIDFLLFVLRHWDICDDIDTFSSFSDNFVKQESERIIGEILPEIIKITSFSSEDRLSDTLDKWSDSWGRYHNGRVFVNLVEKAIANETRKDKDYPKKFLENHWVIRSNIEKELVLKALLLLPPEHAPLVYNWFLSDFPHNLIESTSEKSNKIQLSCEILSRLSKFWSSIELNTFAERVYKYTDPKMIEIAQRRFRWNHDAQNQGDEISYNAYWGNLQQCILPCLDTPRLEKKYLDIIHVLLRRKEQYNGEYYYAKGGMSDVVAVSSPISNHSDELSAKAWIKLLLSENVESRYHYRRSHQFGIESTCEEYARDFEIVMERNPKLFRQVVGCLPAQMNGCYIRAILYLIAKNAVFEEFDVIEIFELLDKFVPYISERTDPSIAIAYCSCILNHANISWPKNILDNVIIAATKHPEPGKDEYALTSSTDPSHTTCHDLLNNGHNCVRGVAFYALSRILWYHEDDADKFRKCVLCGVKDVNPAVRYIVLDSIVPFLNSDACFSWNCFEKLISADIRIIGHHYISYFVNEFLSEHENFFQKIIENALNSGNTDLEKHAARLLAGMFIYHGKFENILFRESYPHHMAKAIVDQMLYTLPQIGHEEDSKKILLHVLSRSDEAFDCIEFRLFSEQMPTEISFVVLDSLQERQFKNATLYSLIKKIRDLEDEEFFCYRKVIIKLCDSIANANKGKFGWYYEDDLIFIMLRLLDGYQNSGDEVAQYLDLFDSLFRQNTISGQNLLKKLQA